MGGIAVRPVARLLVVAVVAASLVGAATRDSWASAHTHAAQENAFTTYTNAVRRGAGLDPLVVNLQLTRVAREWSSRMATQGRLAHNPDLGDAVEGTWTRLGENVGYSSDAQASADDLVDRLHASFLQSPTHRANVMGDFNQVGAGVVIADDTMWVTVVFSRDGSVVPNDAVHDAARQSAATFAAPGEAGRHAGHAVVAASGSPALTEEGARMAGDEAPLLYTHPASRWDEAPVLHPITRAEIDRTLDHQGLVYVIGDSSAVSDQVVRELVGDGYTVRRVPAA